MSDSREATWLDSVLGFLLEAPGRIYQLAPGELAPAARAVKARRLEWVVYGESVQLPTRSAGPEGGPYR